MANAFGNTTISQLQSNVRMLYHRRKMVGRLTITNEEYIQTFVPFGARELFRDITPLLAIDKLGHKFDLRVPSVGANRVLNARLNMHEASPMPVPRVLEIQPDAPKEIVERIHSWSEHGGDVSRDFGRVSRVLTILNENFSRVAIRYYWPTILALCSESDQTKELVREMQEMRAPVKLKPLPPGLPLACRQTAETISTARLIPADLKDDGDDPDDPNVLLPLNVTAVGCVKIGIMEGQQYVEPFSSFFGA